MARMEDTTTHPGADADGTERREPAEPGDEVERIRAVYAERDRARPRGRAIAEAYRRLNAQRLARMRELVERMHLGGASAGERPRLLDVGCGGGYDLARWLEAGWPPERLAGTDLVPERLAAARAACPGVRFEESGGDQLPFEDDSFDVATAVTVFSSILDPEMRSRLFAEMERVVRPGGAILVYDFVVRKPTNPNVVGMPMRLLTELGRRPDASFRLSPLLQLVALAALLGRRAADLAMAVAPPTHRLSVWRVRSGAESTRRG